MGEKPPQYFEGVLQLRNASEQILRWVHKEIIRAQRARIAKVKETPGGIDVYLSEQHYLQSLGRKLQQRFGGVLKITSRLHTRNPITSRDVHRVTVLFRQLPFKKMDVIRMHGEQWRVTGIGKQISLQNLKSGRKMRVQADRLSGHSP